MFPPRPFHYQLHNRLVCHWNLQEASGNATDIAPLGNGLKTAAQTGVDQNTVTQNPGPSTIIAQSRQYTRANAERHQVTDSAAISIGATNFSFTFWMYADNFTNRMRMISKAPSGTPTANSEYYFEYSSSTSRFAWNVIDSTTTIGTLDLTTAGTPSATTWYFIHCWSEDGVQIGGQVGTGSTLGAADIMAWTSGVRDSAANLNIGGPPVTAENVLFGGRIASLSFHKRLLSQQEVKYLFNGGNGKLYPFA